MPGDDAALAVEEAIARGLPQPEVQAALDGVDVWFLSTHPSVDLDDDGTTHFYPLVIEADSPDVGGVEYVLAVFTRESYAHRYLETDTYGHKEQVMTVLEISGHTVLCSANCALGINLGIAEWRDGYRLPNYANTTRFAPD